MGINPMEISVKTKTAYNNPDTRGQNDATTIFLYLPNILKDCGMDINELWYGMNFIYLTEFICRYIHKKPLDRYIPLCTGRDFCPIADSLNKSCFHYNTKFIQELWGKTHKQQKPLNLNTRFDFKILNNKKIN